MTHFVDIEPDDDRLLTDVLPVLQELRGHLTADALRRIYEEGAQQGLRFLAAYQDGGCVGVAGWRIVVNTSAGRMLYVDDLVTTAAVRSTGVGAAMVEELTGRARAAGCSRLELDSGVARSGAHRFYFRAGLTVTAFHFTHQLS